MSSWGCDETEENQDMEPWGWDEDQTDAQINFMGGVSYRINAMDTLRMVTASSAFGEPDYYRFGMTEGTHCAVARNGRK